MPLKNKSMLARVLGIPEAEAADSSLDGRLRTVARLKAAKRVEIARGKAQSWLYDVNRHINLCVLLKQETANLMADLARKVRNCNQEAI
jgi:hypothetical protein